MMPPSIARLVQWLLPNDERAEAVLGDFEEAYAKRSAADGHSSGKIWLVSEVIRSASPLFVAALFERGGRGLLLRSIPAVLVGCLIVILPLVAAPRPAGSFPIDALFSLTVIGGFSVLAGWISATLAGSAPRQHAFALGITTLGLTALLFAQRASGIQVWYWAAVQLVILPGVMWGGARYAPVASRRS